MVEGPCGVLDGTATEDKSVDADTSRDRGMLDSVEKRISDR